MPVLILLLAIAGLILLTIALLPLSLVQRYRVGTARRPARGWVVGLNLATLAVSTLLFLTSAAVVNLWVPQAFAYTAAGLGSGCVLGLAGLALTRWEPSVHALHYTPNRPLVLGVTLLVAARVTYGFWRSWHVWRSGLDGGAVIAAAGVAGSMAAGAVVLGYYLTFWLGVRRRLSRHRHRR